MDEACICLTTLCNKIIEPERVVQWQQPLEEKRSRSRAPAPWNPSPAPSPTPAPPASSTSFVIYGSITSSSTFGIVKPFCIYNTITESNSFGTPVSSTLESVNSREPVSASSVFLAELCSRFCLNETPFESTRLLSTVY